MQKLGGLNEFSEKLGPGIIRANSRRSESLETDFSENLNLPTGPT